MHQTITVPREEIISGQPKVVRDHGYQICIWHTEERTFAFDHRCPHEGYPLSQGNLDGCLLTCHWHNWKFDLRDGRNLDDDDRLRTYPCYWAADHLVIECKDPSPIELRRDLEPQLMQALQKRDYGRLLRIAARFEFGMETCEPALTYALGWSADRMHYGTTHAIAAAPDWLALADACDDRVRRLACVAEVIDHLAFDCLGMDAKPFAQGAVKFDPCEFLDAIEAEDEGSASLLLRGALNEQRETELIQACRRAALQHYRDFGHSLIFLEKTIELCARLKAELREPLYLAWLRGICQSTKEDLLPEFAAYQPTLAAIGHLGTSVSVPHAPAGQSSKTVLHWLVDHRHHTPSSLFTALVKAAAIHMLAFDTGLLTKTRIPIAQNIGWLDFSHGLTFAEAALRACSDQPRLWPQALVQLACFVGRTVYAVDRQRVTECAAMNAAAFSDIDDLIDHGSGLPIYACHRVKTYFAVQALTREHPDSGLLWAAFQRYAKASYPHKQVLRTAQQMVDLIARDHGTTH